MRLRGLSLASGGQVTQCRHEHAYQWAGHQGAPQEVLENRHRREPGSRLPGLAALCALDEDSILETVSEPDVQEPEVGHTHDERDDVSRPEQVPESSDARGSRCGDGAGHYACDDPVDYGRRPRHIGAAFLHGARRYLSLGRFRRRASAAWPAGPAPGPCSTGAGALVQGAGGDLRSRSV